MRLLRDAHLGRSTGLASLILTVAVTVSGPAAGATSGGWSNLGHGATTTTPALNDKVQSFALSGTKLYVGGDFTNAGGIAAADHIAIWSGTAWSAVGGGLGDAPSAVYALAVDGTRVYAGGSFQNAGGETSADGLAVYDGSGWHSILSVGVVGTVFALAISGRTLYVGGTFANMNGIAEADGIAAYGLDSHAWSAITDSSGDIEQVSTIAPDGGGGLYVGGDFINANGIPQADFIAHWNGGVSWSAMGSDLAGTGGALNNGVDEIAVDGSNVYAGGRFTNAAGNANADYIAQWTGSAWASLGSVPFPVNSRVRTVTVSGGIVVVGGYFNNATGNTKADSIAAYDFGTWRNVGTNAAGTDGPVSFNGDLYVLRVLGGKLYAGGPQTIGGSNLNQSAASFKFWQPDEQIKTTAAYVGNNVYNTTGKKQSKALTVQRNHTGTFQILFTNDGFAQDFLQIRGPGSGGGFTVAYFQGTTNITAHVVAGDYYYGLLPNQTQAFTVKVTVGGGVAVGAKRSWLVTEKSQISGVVDAVKATVTAN
jgi:hypothetical protein